MPILHYLDVVVGFALVMLVASTAVLAVAQLGLNASSARARHLTRGIAQLVADLHPQRLRPHALHIAQLVLRHPLLGRPPGLFQRAIAWLRSRLPEPLGSRLPAVHPSGAILREELAHVLIEWAAGQGPLSVSPDDADLPARTVQAQAALTRTLVALGIDDPRQTLRAIRMKAMENEQLRPGDPAHLWRSQALVAAAPTEFVATLQQTFDPTMARVSTSFGSEAQVWAVAGALAVVFLFNIDAIQLLNRLSGDEVYREALVNEAKRLDGSQASAKDPGQKQQLDAEVQQVSDNLRLLASPLLGLSPRELTWEGRKPVLRSKPGAPMPTVPGLLLAWVLVSLGAPFWYDVIKNTLKLRSLVAQSDDKERQARESTTDQAGTQVPSSSTTAAPDQGEAGDLTATGADRDQG